MSSTPGSTIRAVAGVVRGEGIASALRRTVDRVDEALHHVLLWARGALVRPSAEEAEVTILNVAAGGVLLRTGGVATQLMTRLRAEQTMRKVALLSPRGLEISTPIGHSRPVARFQGARDFVSPEFEQAVREALAITGARAIHLEGVSGVPVGSALRLLQSGVPVVVTVHDFSLFCARPHLFEQPMDRFCSYSHDLERCHRCLEQTWKVSRGEQAERRSLGRSLLESATGLIFPSRFLLEQHRDLFSMPGLAGEIIEPGAPPFARALHPVSGRRAIAFAGSVKRHKGAHLLPDIVKLVSQANRDVDWHVFGGGDEDLLCEIRRVPSVRIHGYYRAGTLPSLLARHGIGMIVFPSIVPETYSLVLSEAWQADAGVAAFDLGAVAERVGRNAGWLTPLESGAAGLAGIIERWLSGQINAVPGIVATPIDAARAHVDLYRRWGVGGD